MEILFAASDRDLLHSYGRLLQLDGADVTSAFDGIQTLTYLESQRFDIVIIEETLHRVELKALLGILNNKGISSIVISERRISSEMLCERDIACSYLPLPFLPDEMRACLKSVLDKKQSGKSFAAGDANIDTKRFLMDGVRVTGEETDIMGLLSREEPVTVKNKSVYIDALNIKLSRLNKTSRIKYISGKGYRLVNENG